MDNMKIKNKLSEESLNEIRESQTDIIMDKIYEFEKKKIPQFRTFNMNYVYVALLATVLIVLPILTYGTNIFGPKDYTIDHVYTTLEDYKERLEEVDIESLEVVSQEEVQANTSLMRLSNLVSIYTRDQLEDIYLNQTPRIEQGQYVNGYHQTTVFIDNVLDVIDNTENIKLNEYVDVDETLYVYSRFMFSVIEEDTIVIKATQSTLDNDLQIVFKIGLNNDKIELKTLQYDLTPAEWLVLSSASPTFNYFELMEDEHVLSINGMNDLYSLSYFSMENQYIVNAFQLHNMQEVEEDSIGLLMSVYDIESNIFKYIESVDDVITGEFYIIYNQYGSVIEYVDYNINDTAVNIKWNMMEASGWDTVIAGDIQDTGYFDEGFYLDGEFVGSFGDVGVIRTDEHVSVFLEQTVLVDDITNSLLQLENTGFTWNDSSITVEYLNSIKVEDINELKDKGPNDLLDFFGGNIYDELYHYLDDELKE